MTTLQNVLDLVRQRTNIEVNSGFISDAELTTYINYALSRLDGTLRMSSQDYNFSSAIFTTPQNVDGYNFFSLPADFKEGRLVERLWGTQFVRIPNFHNWERDRYYWAGFLPPGLVGTYYRIEGNQCTIEPWSNAAGTYRMFYVPKYAPLVNPSDALASYMDDLSWIEYAVLAASIKVLAKQDLDTSALMSQEAEARQYVIESMRPRDTGGVEKAIDVRSGDFGGWGHRGF